MNAELILYYQNLLLLQYRKPKAQATISALITLLMIYDLMISVRDGYNLDTAIGVQLDILGKYLGVLRVVEGFPLETPSFGYARYGDSFPVPDIESYSVYGVTPVSPGWISYFDGQSTYMMTDDEYRIILKMAVARKNGNSSVQEIDSVLFPAFSNNYLAIEGPMTIEYQVQTAFKRLAQLVQGAGLFPKPMAVLTTLVVQDVLSS